jgi:hypothetical protein
VLGSLIRIVVQFFNFDIKFFSILLNSATNSLCFTVLGSVDLYFHVLC